MENLIELNSIETGLDRPCVGKVPLSIMVHSVSLSILNDRNIMHRETQMFALCINKASIRYHYYTYRDLCDFFNKNTERSKITMYNNHK